MFSGLQRKRGGLSAEREVSLMGDEADDLNAVLARWNKRFQRSISLYDEAFAEHGFDDLVVTVVTATYIEGLLYLGVQFSGYAMKPAERLMLGKLVTIADEHGTVSGDLVNILRLFTKVRNGFAHDLDYRVESATVERIYSLLETAAEI
jgi:hypothetical protein